LVIRRLEHSESKYEAFILLREFSIRAYWGRLTCAGIPVVIPTRVLEASRNIYFHHFLEFIGEAKSRLYETEGILIQRKNEAFFVIEGTLPESAQLATLSAQEEEAYSRRRPPIGKDVPVVPNMGGFVAEAQGWIEYHQRNSWLDFR
jgi:hypothetical protein